MDELEALFNQAKLKRSIMQGVLCGKQYQRPVRVNAEVENKDNNNNENGENGDDLQEII